MEVNYLCLLQPLFYVFGTIKIEKFFKKKFAGKEKGCIFAVPIEKGMWQMPRKLFEKAVSEKNFKKLNKNLEVQK